MRLSNCIKAFGIIDLFYVIWIIVVALSQNNIPVIDDLIRSLKAGFAFGEELSLATLGFVAISIFGSLLIVTVLFSGVLMFRLNPLGVYISIFQTPFKFLLVIPPTFFF